MNKMKNSRPAAWLLWGGVVLIVIGCGSGKQEEQQATQESLEFVQAYLDKTQGLANQSKMPIQVSLRVGEASDPDVCTDGELYGPFTVTDGVVSETDPVDASQPSLRHSNIGDMTVCMIVISPMDATISVAADTVYMETTECGETPENLAGIWSGDYSCSSECGDFSGTVTLEIFQDDYSATYTDDDDAYYEGTVCGNEFKYSGGSDDYEEKGTFILNGDGTGSKNSTYMSIDGMCSGTCSDPVLTRQSN